MIVGDRLVILVPAWEDWDPVSQKFLHGKETKLTLAHSLISISKWEMKYHKPYLTEEPKTMEETLDYVRFMTVANPNREIGDEVYRHLTMENMREIEQYIADPMTATTFHRWNQKPGGRKIITNEQIYYSMAAFGIPMECQQWHFNRLMTLLEVAADANRDPKEKKMSVQDVYSRNRALNAMNRARFHSTG